MFLLSAEEAENSAYGFVDNNARIAYYGGSVWLWWLLSPYLKPNDYYAGLVDDYGCVVSGDVVNKQGICPAFNLDLNSVLFASAAVGGKIPAAGSGGNQGNVDADVIFEISDYTGNEWKLTLLDNSRNFAVTEETVSGKHGDTITLNYSEATTGTNEYISVIIADNNGAQYYGRVAQPTGASGQIQIKIPISFADGTYTLYVFSEQYNGDYKTDYASAFAEVSLIVDTTEPTLSNGSATRDSETAATVKFTSNEAGKYYYAVVESGATTPTITTTGTRTPYNSGENTIYLDNLSSKSAKDIYIVVNLQRRHFCRRVQRKDHLYHARK